MQHQGFMQRSGLDPEVGFLMDSGKHFTVTDARYRNEHVSLMDLKQANNQKG